jgi:hypothetical protein
VVHPGVEDGVHLLLEVAGEALGAPLEAPLEAGEVLKAGD